MTPRLLSVVREAARRATKPSLVGLAMFASFMLTAMQPAQAQTADTWKSVAIIGGATAGGAYVGHKFAGPIGGVVGAGAGATAGYAIDRYRRNREYYSSQYPYGNGGYPNSGVYQGDNRGPYGGGGYPGNGGPYGGGPYDEGGYRPGYLNSSYRYSQR